MLAEPCAEGVLIPRTRSLVTWKELEESEEDALLSLFEAGVDIWELTAVADLNYRRKAMTESEN